MESASESKCQIWSTSKSLYQDISIRIEMYRWTLKPETWFGSTVMAGSSDDAASEGSTEDWVWASSDCVSAGISTNPTTNLSEPRDTPHRADTSRPQH